jgi:hypothetical protein
VQRIALVDARSVLGWPTWREIEARYWLGLIKVSLQTLRRRRRRRSGRARRDGGGRPQPAGGLAAGCLNDASGGL